MNPFINMYNILIVLNLIMCNIIYDFSDFDGKIRFYSFLGLSLFNYLIFYIEDEIIKH